MKKILTATLLILTLFICLPLFSSAQEYSRLTDNADLLTANEESIILAKLNEVSSKQNFDIAILTVESLPYNYNSIVSFADDFYDYNGFGIGNNYDGCILVLDMDTRDWYVSTCGYGIIAVNSDAIDKIEEDVIPHLSNGNYKDGFEEYISLCDMFITQARSGTPYKAPTPWLVLIFVSLGVGVLIAFIAVSVMKSKLKSVRFKPHANEYILPGSMNITQSRDTFLYSNVTFVIRNTDSRGGGMHTSSAGRSHGGGGGRF